MQSSVHAPYVLAFTGPYVSQIGSDQRYESIYGIRRIYRTSLSTKWPEHSSQHACTLWPCMDRSVSWPNLVGSKSSRNLWNEGNVPDISEHIIWQMHKPTYMHVLLLSACQKHNQVRSDYQRDQRIYGIRGTCQTCLSKQYDPQTQASIHACYILACTGLWLS